MQAASALNNQSLQITNQPLTSTPNPPVSSEASQKDTLNTTPVRPTSTASSSTPSNPDKKNNTADNISPNNSGGIIGPQATAASSLLAQLQNKKQQALGVGNQNLNSLMGNSLLGQNLLINQLSSQLNLFQNQNPLQNLQNFMLQQQIQNLTNPLLGGLNAPNNLSSMLSTLAANQQQQQQQQLANQQLIYQSLLQNQTGDNGLTNSAALLAKFSNGNLQSSLVNLMSQMQNGKTANTTSSPNSDNQATTSGQNSGLLSVDQTQVEQEKNEVQVEQDEEEEETDVVG